MRTFIQVYETIKQKAKVFSKYLRFDKLINKIGRKLALTIEEIISLALFKQTNGIAAKKSLYKIFQPDCSYKTLVVNLNRFAPLALKIFLNLLQINRRHSHPVKHIDSTDIPVCLFKNAHAHKIMKGLSSFGRSAKGVFFALKMHIVSDLNKQLLSVRFATGNIGDREMVIPLSKDLAGIFVADAGYISAKLSRAFYQEGKRILLAQPRKNMKKIITAFQNRLYGTRMMVEIHFRSLKLFYGLLTSLPRSASGYLANYIYSLLAYQLA